LGRCRDAGCAQSILANSEFQTVGEEERVKPRNVNVPEDNGTLTPVRVVLRWSERNVWTERKKEKLPCGGFSFCALWRAAGEGKRAKGKK
jgi:hypothetical protein